MGLSVRHNSRFNPACGSADAGVVGHRLDDLQVVLGPRHRARAPDAAGRSCRRRSSGARHAAIHVDPEPLRERQSLMIGNQARPHQQVVRGLGDLGGPDAARVDDVGARSRRAPASGAPRRPASPPTNDRSVPSSAARPPRQTVESTTCTPRGSATLRQLLHGARVHGRQHRDDRPAGRSRGAAVRRSARAARGRNPRRRGSHRPPARASAERPAHSAPCVSTASRFPASIS